MTQQNARTRARELVLQALYASETGGASDGVGLDELLTKEKLDTAIKEFARFLYVQVTEKSAWADETISKLATNWRLERIAVIDKIIMRMAMTELAEIVDTPVKVVLNEAIELAKQYSTAESASFINGILDKFASDLIDR